MVLRVRMTSTLRWYWEVSGRFGRGASTGLQVSDDTGRGMEFNEKLKASH